MAVTNTPNMTLPVPVVGVELGPQYALDINACMAILDAHTHVTGSGVAITPNAININVDLPFQSNNATTLRSVSFVSNGAPLALTADIRAIYTVNADLYYNDSSGTAIRLTQSGAVAGTPGSIANLLSPASATWVPGSATFVWQSAANTAGNMDFGNAILRNATINSKGLTLQAPGSMGADYSLTLPPLPASQKIMTLDASGIMTAPYTVDNNTIGITSNVIHVKDSSITNAILANMAALSVKANATNASAAPTDLVAAYDAQVLVRSGTALAFAQVQTAGISDGAITGIKQANAVTATGASTSATIANGTGNASTGELSNVSLTISGTRNVLMSIQPANTGGIYSSCAGASNRVAVEWYVDHVLVANAEFANQASGDADMIGAMTYVATNQAPGVHTYGFGVTRISGSSVGFRVTAVAIVATQL